MREFRAYGAWIVGVATIVACGGRGSGFGEDGGGVDGSSDATQGSDGPQFGFDGGGTDGPNGCTQCSADLHEVTTCGDNPQVLQTCTGNQGCGPNGCIAACDAAAANKSSIGCDYYAIPVDGWSTTYNSGGAAGGCFAAFVNNVWASDLNVTLTWKGNTINGNNYAYIPKGSGSAITYTKVPSTGIPANTMAIVFLNDYVAGQGSLPCHCPASVQAAVSSEDMINPHLTSKEHAIEVKTDVPAVVYDIYPYGGATSYIASATLLLPTTAWDTNYVATTMGSTIYGYPSGVDFIAQQDGTTVTVLPNTDITGAGGVASATKGNPVTYSLNKGETVHIMQLPDSSGNDLTGSVVQSNYPIGVWGEHFCMTQNDPPPWRVVGMVDGTTLTYDPPVSGAPTTLKEGQLVEFPGPGAFHVKAQDAQHPFYLAAHRPGGDCDAAHQQIPPIKAEGFDYVAVGNEATYYSVGGPETVNVVPPAQFLLQYTFFTDPSYGYTEIALTRQKGSDSAFHDVSLDCLGTVTGWKNVDNAGAYQYVHVDLATAGSGVGKCANGLHTIMSDVPFGITVWGYDSASSYAYPAGASVKPINTVVVPPTPH
jgi:hypothetical protein